MSGAALFVALLEPDTAGHLAVAIKRHREELARRGRARPPGLADIEAVAVQAATGSQEQPRARSVPTAHDTGLHDQEWLSPQDVATVTGLSVSTVRRHIRSGELRSGKVGGRRLVARADLEDFMNRRRSDSGGERTLACAHERPAANRRAEGGTSRRPVRSVPNHEED